MIMLQQHVVIDNYKIRYLTGGNSRYPLILLHGLGASAERWDPIIPLLKKHFNLIIPDIIGFGYSDKPAVDYTMGFFVNFVKKFLDQLGISKTHVMGSSMGAQISAEFTLVNNDRVNKLVLVSPTGTATSMSSTLDRYVMAALYPSNDYVTDAFDFIGMIPEDNPQQFIDDFVQRMKLPNAKLAFLSTILGLKDSSNIRDRLHRIKVPTMLIWGGKDMMIPETHSKYFISRIPDCNYLHMPESGHTPFTEYPEAFCRHVKKFFGV